MIVNLAEALYKTALFSSHPAGVYIRAYIHMCLYVGASFYTTLLTLCLPIMLYIGRVILGLIKPIYSVIDTPGTGGLR